MRPSGHFPVIPIYTLSSSFLFLLLLISLSSDGPTPASALATRPTPSSPPPVSATILAARACLRAAKHDPNVKPSFCASALKSTWLSSAGPGGSKRRARRPFPRTLPGVAELSVRAALGNASATTAAIRRMLLPDGKIAASGDRRARVCVKDCLDLYSGAADGLRDSVRAVREGRLDDARTWISAALDAPGTCDDGFVELARWRRMKGKGGGRGGRTWNPLRKNDKDMFQLSAMALTFVSLLQT